MKSIVSLLLLFFTGVFSHAQRLLPITTDQTTSLVFPDAVIHADRGTPDVLVQLIKESGKIILVKAACRNFHPTSLSVVTADGTIYSFIVRYDSLPASLVHRIIPEQRTTIAEYATGLLLRAPFLKGVKDKSWGIAAAVSGIYIQDSTLYYQLTVSNTSPITYDIDQLRFYTRDRHKSRRTTVQENELTPLYKSHSTIRISTGQSKTIVVAFDKFTIPDGKIFAIEMSEKNGGRNLQLTITNRKIIQAVPLVSLIN